MEHIPRWLALQMEIDYDLFLLDQIKAACPKNTIDAAIDDATGHSAELLKDAKKIMRRIRQSEGDCRRINNET